MRLPKLGLRSLMAIAHAVRRHGDVGPARDRKRMSRSSGMLKGTPALLLVSLALSLAVFAVFAKPASSRQQSSLGERAQAGAVISTDRQVYLAGETINVFGSGFSPYERVGLRVTHANGNTEANMGHEMWWANADLDGTFKAAWTMNSGDSAGTGFIIEAEGSSGSNTRAAFARGAAITTDRPSYDSGEKTWITARGFNPGERVNIAVQDGRNRAPLSRLADENGQVRTEVELPAEKQAAGFVTIQATATESGVMSSLTIPSFFTVLDQQGANDVPYQSDLTQMGRDDSDPSYYQIFWSWDSIDMWTGNGQTGDACALFDSDGDSNINYAVCGQIINLNGNPNLVVQTTGSPFAFLCNNKRPDRCGNPVPKGYVSSGASPDIQAGPLPGSTATPPGNLITDTDPFGPTAPLGPGSNYPYDATLYMKIKKAFLPPNSIFVNVCSYPSAGNGGNNNPFDCIVTPAGGFLVIKKVANANTTSATNFTFQVSPVPSGEPSSYTVTGSGQTPAIGLAIGNNSETVTEAGSQNWTLTGADCTLDSGAVTGSFDKTNHKVSSITIESGKTTTCTFTNYEGPPNISSGVVKDNDGNRDAFFNDNETLLTSAVYPYTVTYKVSITNSGGTGTISSIIDDKTGSLTLTANTTAPAGASSCASLIATTIGYSVSKTCYYDVTFANANAAQVINHVTVTVTSPAGNSQGTDTATVNFPQFPILTLAKSANPTTYSAVGQVITYTYTITNSGNVTLAGPFSVSDDKQPTVSCPTGSLALGASITCTSTRTITLADINAVSITNKATASGNGVTSNQASATVTAVQTKALTIAKSASPTTYSTVGQVITYTYTITNGGNTTLDGPFSVSDDKQPTVSCPTGSLAPGASITCTSLHTITQDDINAGSIDNTASASGSDVTSNSVTVTVTAVKSPALTLVKSANPTSYNAVDQVITYTYIITNSGNTTLAGPFTVTDNPQGTISCGTGPLAPGATTSCTSTHTITQADINAGSITNTATAFGNGVTSSVVSVTVIANQTMSIDLVDGATPTFSSPPVAGDTINYSYKITNTGNVILSGVVLNDASLPGFETPGGTCGVVTTLIPGASTTCSGIYTLTDGDITAGHVSVTNVAQACGNPPSGPVVCDTLNVRVQQ